MEARAAASAPMHAMLVDFLSAAVQMVLHTRGLYPDETFERCRLWDVQVVRYALAGPSAAHARMHRAVGALFRTRHAELAEYISGALDGLAELLRRGEADALVMLIHDGGAVCGSRRASHATTFPPPPSLPAPTTPPARSSDGNRTGPQIRMSHARSARTTC